MKNYLTNFKDSVIFGSLLFSLTIFGIVFIPFVPIVVLFGGFDQRATHMGDGLASLGATFILGVVVYVSGIVYIVSQTL